MALSGVIKCFFNRKRITKKLWATKKIKIIHIRRDKGKTLKSDKNEKQKV